MSKFPTWIKASRPAMGTVFEVILCGEDAEWLRDAAAQALDEVERLDALLSPYQPGSEIHTLNQDGAAGWVRLDHEAYQLLERALELARISGGAFDPTVGALIQCWGFFRGQGAPATPEAVREALSRSGWERVEIDPSTLSARFTQPGVVIHPGAIGKGYAVDRAISLLRELGVDRALVHGGTSTLYALGAPPGETGWSIGLCDPENRETRMAVTCLRNTALSTSGDYEQFFELEGHRYSHILDPRTGYPATGTRSSTVTAESAADTDALSTAAFVLGVEGARELLEHFSEVAAAMVPESPLPVDPFPDRAAPLVSPARMCDDGVRTMTNARRLVVLGDFPLTPAA